MHLLQVCNVGNIVGGTAACAWGVVRAFPDCRHTLFFRSVPTLETRAEFLSCFGVEQIRHRQCLSAQEVLEINPDLILMHNISASAIDSPLQVPSFQYVHSQISPAPAEHSFCCSHWLAERLGWPESKVVWQGVPQSAGEPRQIRTKRQEPLIVGRICTPSAAKWPPDLIPFYKELADRFPEFLWEFVGCPEVQQELLNTACNGKALFHPAGWEARQHLNRWHVLLYHHPHMSESFGRTVAEAKRVGCVPVVDQRGGFQEQISPGHGFLCANREEFAVALEKLINPDVWTEVSTAAREEAEQVVSIRAFRDRLLEQFSLL